MLPESHYLHSGYFGPVRRSWQSDGRDEVSKSQVCAKINNFETVNTSFPGFISLIKKNLRAKIEIKKN